MSVRALARRPVSPPAAAAFRRVVPTMRGMPESGFGHQLANIPVHPAGQVIQANGLAAAAAVAAGPVGIGLGLAGLGGYALYRHWTRDRRTHQDLAQRLGALEGYQHDAGAGAAGRLTAQYQQLHQLEQEAHTWMRDRNAAASQGDRAAMFTVLDRINTHRQTLVDHTLTGNHPLWLPDDVGHHEAVRARGIWDSVRQNQGNIQIHGGGGFRTRVLADTSKLLQSQHGRDMLGELDADQHGDAARQIRISADWSPQGLVHPDSWARPIGDNPQANSPAQGVHGTGAGSHVQIHYGPAGDAQSGTRLEPIHNPTYLTLGHELGHARRSLAGRTRGDVTWDRPHDPTHVDPQRAELEQGLWNNPEEFENITTEENPLRRQLGLPSRSYHRAHPAVVRTHQRERMRQRYQAAFARLQPEEAYGLAGHDPAYGWAHGYGVDWNQAHSAQQAEASIAAFEGQVAALQRRRLARRVGFGLAGLGGLALAGGAAYLGWGRQAR